ncbi:heme iron utilization protein [[Actinobacillus] muris]|uniref:Heme iron utilization protein n=1 Tax=Muribacter muris TaxID=67855 RepID=A0A0J5S6N1_9PAST|nr:heme utilization cystosolic carrier protein HutX [Muribacter muris]KMK52522.1 heme iron utilization protein [[Actinobacillus] muris] [Muribacter muris]
MALTEKVAELLAQNPNLIPLEMAEMLQCPEGEVLCALPAEFIRVFPPERAESLLTTISEWGTFTTIIEKAGSIFEIKDRFPSGSIGRGYYNLNMKGQEGALHGHLKLTNIAKIVFVSLPFRGKESYHIAFIANDGQVMFKVYLGRDEQRRLLPEQVARFKQFQ